MQAQLLNSDFLQKSICCLLVPKVDTMFLEIRSKRANRNRMLLPCFSTTGWYKRHVVEGPAYENIIWTQSQVSLAASGGSKGRCEDSWSSKKRLPICLLTKNLRRQAGAHLKKHSECVSPILSKFCWCYHLPKPDRAFIDTSVWLVPYFGDTYIHSNANPSASIWATGAFAPHSSIAPCWTQSHKLLWISLACFQSLAPIVNYNCLVSSSRVMFGQGTLSFWPLSLVQSTTSKYTFNNLTFNPLKPLRQKPFT